MGLQSSEGGYSTAATDQHRARSRRAFCPSVGATGGARHDHEAAADAATSALGSARRNHEATLAEARAEATALLAAARAAAASRPRAGSATLCSSSV